MSKIIDLVGKQFGRLKVLQLDGLNKENQYTWLCQCSCGKIVSIRGYSLRNGATKSCGCLNMERQPRNKLPGTQGLENIVYIDYKTRAESKNLEFSLSKQEFLKLCQTNCHYCNRKPSNMIKNIHDKYFYNGIDRMDNNKGYTLENSLPCCKICNRAKRDMPYQEFIDWIHNIVIRGYYL